LDEGLRAAPDGDSEVRVRLLTGVSMWPFGFPDEAGTEADRERGLKAGREAAEMARRLNRPDLESVALDGMESYYMVLGLYGVAYPGKHRRLELVDGLGDPLEVGDAFAMSSGTELATGSYREAFRLADEGFRRTVDEMPAAALHNVAWRGQARFRMGDWDGVLTDVERAQDLLGERRDEPPYFAVGAFAAAQFVHQSRGDTGPADRLHDMLTGQLGGRGRMPQGLFAWMVLCDARRGDFERARRHLESQVWVETFHGSRYLLYECRSVVLAWEEAWDDVPAFLEECRAHAQRAELVALPAFADRLEGRTVWAKGDRELAEDLLARSGDVFRRLEARWEAALADLWLAEARMDGGDATGPLERARSVFEDMRSLPELEQVRRLSDRLG
jgi:hypothetical protein